MAAPTGATGPPPLDGRVSRSQRVRRRVEHERPVILGVHDDSVALEGQVARRWAAPLLGTALAIGGQPRSRTFRRQRD